MYRISVFTVALFVGLIGVASAEGWILWENLIAYETNPTAKTETIYPTSEVTHGFKTLKDCIVASSDQAKHRQILLSGSKILPSTLDTLFLKVVLVDDNDKVMGQYTFPCYPSDFDPRR